MQAIDLKPGMVFDFYGETLTVVTVEQTLNNMPGMEIRGQHAEILYEGGSGKFVNPLVFPNAFEIEVLSPSKI